MYTSTEKTINMIKNIDLNKYVCTGKVGIIKMWVLSKFNEFNEYIQTQ